MEFRQEQEPNLSSKQGGRQTRSYQQSSGHHQELFEQTVGYPHTDDASGLRYVIGNGSPTLKKSLLPDSSLVFQGMALFISDSAEARSQGFWVRQARCPIVHLECRSSLDVTIWTAHGSNVLGVSDNSHFTSQHIQRKSDQSNFQ